MRKSMVGYGKNIFPIMMAKPELEYSLGGLPSISMLIDQGPIGKHGDGGPGQEDRAGGLSWK